MADQTDERGKLDQILAGVQRILQLQRLDDLTAGDAALLRSTQSNTCSSASTGGCHIEGRVLAAPTG